MSIIEKLTEGVVNRDMKAEGAALLNKWSATGLLEGLGTQHEQHTMARLLENQAKELLREASSIGAGDVEGFAAVAFPIVRRVFAGLIANDLVSVQPMSLPSGLIFFLDFVYSGDIGASSSISSRFGNTADKSIYGTDRVGSEITGGVNLVGSTLKESLSGPRQMTGYAYSSPTSSVALTDAASDACIDQVIDLSNLTEANKKALQYDPDILAGLTGSSSKYVALQINVPKANLGDADFNNLSAFVLGDIANIDFVEASGNVSQVRRLTEIHPSDSSIVRFTLVGVSGSTGIGGYAGMNFGSVMSASALGGAITVEVPRLDNISAGGGVGSVVGGTEFGLENNALIPEIDIKVDSIAITAQTKKLKAKWTPELGQDLNAYHNLDAEVELTSILSEQIALEIDREILADLVNGATAATYYWSRSPGLFVNRATGAEIGASAAAPDFTGTVSEWYETLIETINDVSAQIHRKTLRGGANYVVVSPEVANILEFTAGFRANVTADVDKGEIGAVKVGSLSRKFDVIVDPYFPRNAILVGRKGASFLESGYIYAPYVPLQTTPTIFDPESFVPRKGVMTRYAKKMVRPDMYGLVVVRGLLGESGATS
jgi:hypothetical protein